MWQMVTRLDNTGVNSIKAHKNMYFYEYIYDYKYESRLM